MRILKNLLKTFQHSELSSIFTILEITKLIFRFQLLSLNLDQLRKIPVLQSNTYKTVISVSYGTNIIVLLSSSHILMTSN